MATRQDILDALLTLGEANGLENVSLSDIADEVGIRKASIYSHFESQQQIIEEAAEYCRRILGSKDFNVDFKAKDARSPMARDTTVQHSATNRLFRNAAINWLAASVVVAPVPKNISL